MVNLSLENFILHPDTVPIILRDRFLANEEFIKEHKIREGTALTGGYYIDYVNRNQIEGIYADVREDILSILPIPLTLLDRQNLSDAGILEVLTNPYLSLKGGGCLVGFIDTGIDFTQNCFKYEDNTTKIKYIWDQSVTNNAPNNFNFGSEYTENDINTALNSIDPYKIVPHHDNEGHGTFLASIAAGRESGDYIGGAPDAEIIAVKLRSAPPFIYEHYLVPENLENVYSSADFLLGIEYIINRAKLLNMPVAICIAVGSNFGGHDGLGIAEEYLTRISSITGIALTAACGNEVLSGHHFEGRLKFKDEIHNIELLASDEYEDIFISMWSGASNRLAVSILSPSGELIPKISIRSGVKYTTNLLLEKSRVSIEYFLPVRGSGDQFTGIKILHATPGIWKIQVHGEIVLDGKYHLWLPINGFINSSTKFLNSSPNYTIVTPSTSSGVISCGAYDSKNSSLYPFSSWGPSRSPFISPDIVAPGVNVGGVFPKGYGVLSGTSVSAAITTGACALMLEWGIINKNDITLTSSRIRANLIRGAIREANMDYPNYQWGYGKLNLYNTFKIIRPM